MSKKLPLVSIICTAYNEEKDIGSFLDSLVKLNYLQNRLDIIIVDDGSTDKTREIVKKYKVRLIKSSHLGFGDARNLGIKYAKGDILIFLDADMIIHKNYVKEVVNFLNKNNEFSAFEGIEYIKNENKIIAKMFFLTNLLGFKKNKIQIPRVVKKSVIKKIKKFNPDYGYYIDWELQQRIIESGFKIGHSPKAIIYHMAPEDMLGTVRKMKWAGKSMAFILKQNIFVFIRKTLFVFLCGFMPVYILLSFISYPFNFLGIIPLTIFILFEIFRTIQIFNLSKNKLSFLMPIFDVMTMMIFIYGIFIGILQIRTKPKV